MSRLQEHDRWIQNLAQRSADWAKRLEKGPATDVMDAQTAARKGLAAINFFASKLGQTTARHAPEENRYCTYFVIPNPGPEQIRYACISLYQETGNTHMTGLWELTGENLVMSGEHNTSYPGGLAEKLLGTWKGITLDKPKGLYVSNSRLVGSMDFEGLFQNWVNGVLPQ